MRPATALLVALGLTLGGLAVLVWLIPAAPMTGDGQYYIQFVRNGLQHGASSWHERRLLGPLIVRALPLDAQAGFFVLTVVSLAATSMLTWAAARDLIREEGRALLAIPLLFATWAVAPNLREYGLVDPLAWAFVAGVWWATVRRNWMLAAGVAAVGVVAKEIVVLAAVAAAAAAFEGAFGSRTSGAAASERGVGSVAAGGMNARSVWLPAVVGGPAILVALALTVVFPGSGSDAAAYVLKWVRDGLFSNGVPRAAFLLFASYGALWLLIPLGWSGLPAHLRRAATVLIAAAVLLPLVGSPERMEEAIFPLVVSTALLAIRAWPLGLGWLLAIACDLFVARIGGDARLPTVVAWSGLVVALALVAWSYASALGFRRAPALAPGSGPPGTTAPSR